MADKLEVSKPTVVRHHGRRHILTVQPDGFTRVLVFGMMPPVEIDYPTAADAVSDLRALAGMVERAIAAGKPRRKAASPPAEA